jgi:hypothetical protein
MLRAALSACAKRWVTVMDAEKDPVLTRLFAEDEGLDPSPSFADRVEQRIAQLRRGRRLQTFAVVAAVPAVAIAAGPRLLERSAEIIGRTTQALSMADGFLSGPQGMALGLAVAAGAVLYARLASRAPRRG